MTYEIIRFRNTVNAALKVKEFNWLETFIEDCIPKLLPQHRASMKSFSLGRLEFERGNFEKALEHASKIQFDMFTYKIDVKNLLLLTYYELELFDQAEYLIDTYKHYVKHTKDYSQGFLRQYKNFIDIYNSLLKIRSSVKTKNADLLLKKAEDTDVLPFRAWFIKKIKQLQK